MKHGAERTPADRTASVKRRRLSSTKHSLEPGRVPVLADLPETVLLQVFKRLGLDRLTAQQGARRAPATSALQSACHKQRAPSEVLRVLPVLPSAACAATLSTSVLVPGQHAYEL